MINLKKYSVLFFLLILVHSTNAQYKKPTKLNDPDYDVGRRLRFGFSLGINTMDFSIRSNKNFQVSPKGDTTQYFVDVSHIIPGFNVNAISDFRLSENFHLRFLPGYAFGQRNLNFFYPNSNLKTQMRVESSFIELPLSIKYSAQRINNVRPYLLFGGNFRIDLASYKKLNVEEGVLLRLVKADAYYEIGFGIDFFLEYFKFAIEFKYSAGVLNVLSRDYADGAENYVQAIEKINSQLFIVAFHFE